MTGWPAIFRRVDRAEDAFDQPRDDRFDFALACYCYGHATRDENLAWWVPQIRDLCREHDRTARGLPLRTPYAKRKRSLAPRWCDLGLAGVEFLPWDASWRIGFRCSCILNASVDPLTGYLRPDARWSCYDHAGPS